MGGIYVTNYALATPTTASFIDLTTPGIDVLGSAPSTLTTNGTGGRGLPNDITVPSRDIDAFTWVGKAGLGDIEIR